MQARSDMLHSSQIHTQHRITLPNLTLSIEAGTTRWPPALDGRSEHVGQHKPSAIAFSESPSLSLRCAKI